MKQKSKKFIVGVVLLVIGVIGIFGAFAEQENLAYLLIGSVLFIAAGVVLIVLDKKTPTKPVANTSKAAAQHEPYVFVTTKGKHFHYEPNCGGIQNAIKMDLSKAKEAGYTACDKCCYDYLKD